MLNWTFLEGLLVVSSINSAICVAFIQKIKKLFSCSKCIPIYSLAINIVFAILFTISFTDIKLPHSLWVGLFSYIGADSLYKTLEGKLSSYRSLTNKQDDTSSLDVIKYE